MAANSPLGLTSGSVGLLCKKAIPKEHILLSFGFDPDPRIFEIHTKIAGNLRFFKQTHLLVN
jgi:hypothetical protein